MAAPAELITKINDYQGQGYTPDEIVQGIIQGSSYPDVARKANAYRKAGYTADEILGGIRGDDSQAAPDGYRTVTADGSNDESAAEALYNSPVPLTADNLKALREQKSLLKTAKEFGRGAMPYVRPVLETGGAIGGAILGGAADIPTGVIPGAVVGSALGYGMGAKAADVLDSLVDAKGRPIAPGIGGQMMQSAGDIGTGAALEMGGQLIGKAIETGVPLVTKGYRTVRDALPTMTETGLKRRAGNVITDNLGDNPRFALNQAEADSIGIPGYQPSLAEATNSPGLIKLQRGIERAPGKAADIIAENKTANQQAVQSYLDEMFPGSQNVDDVAKVYADQNSALEGAANAARNEAKTAVDSLPAAPAQNTGEEIAGTIGREAAPVKAEMEKRFAEIPNYEVDTPDLTRKVAEMRDAKLPMDQKERLGKILDYVEEMTNGGNTGLHDLRTVDQTLNQYWVNSRNRNNPNFDEILSGFYGGLKGALRNDINRFGGQVNAGSLMEHNGKLVDTGVLSRELENNLARIDAIRGEQTPDLAAMSQELGSMGSTQHMRVPRESDASYLARVTDAYRKATGKEPPVTLSAGNTRLIDDLTSRNATISDTLNNLEPGKNAAALYNNANRYAENQYFNRFERGEVGNVQRFGNEANRLKSTFEEIPAKFTTPSGADDLIRAVGQDEAQRLMFQHYSRDLVSRTNPVTGELSNSTAMRWLKQNGPTLDKYGLTDKFADLASLQKTAEAAKSEYDQFTKTAAAKFLGADADKAVDAAMQTSPKNTAAAMQSLIDAIGDNPDARRGLENAFRDFLVTKAETTMKNIAGDNIISPAAIQKVMVKYEPAMQTLFSPEQVQAMDKVRRAIETQGRSARSPLGGGSDTAENVAMAQGIITKLAGPVVRWGTVGLNVLNKLNASQMNELIARALYDPQLAATLVSASRQGAKVTQRQLNQHLIRLGILTGHSMTESN